MKSVQTRRWLQLSLFTVHRPSTRTPRGNSFLNPEMNLTKTKNLAGVHRRGPSLEVGPPVRIRP